MSQKHERPIAPFADIHAEDGKVRVTLLHDPKVDGLDAALYLDSSGSMKDEYAYDKPVAGSGRKVVKHGLLRRLFGMPPVEKVEGAAYTNQVEPQARRLLAYLAGKDRNGKLRVAYWSDGVQPIAELTAEESKTCSFPGAKFGGTYLAPAVKDYVGYLEAQRAAGAKRGLMVIMTDGELSDEKQVVKALNDFAAKMKAGELPPASFLIVGVGSGVDEEQLERLSHQEYAGIDHMVCHRIAEEIEDVAEVASTLVDESMTVARSGAIYDENMKLVRRYDDRLPAVLEFMLPAGHKNFTLEMDGKRYTQRVPDEEHEEELETAGGH
jgi:hypothetical protein